MDEDLKRRSYKKLAERLPRRYKAWQAKKGYITMHAAHPLADIRPRHQFLIALDNVTPEVKAELNALGPLFQQACTSAEDWGHLEWIVTHSDSVTEDRRVVLADVHANLRAWAEHWRLAEHHWTAQQTWVLDWAVSYLKVAPQRWLAYTAMSDPVHKEHLTRDERRAEFEFEETIPIYALRPEFRQEYIESTLRKWGRELENCLTEKAKLLDEKYGTLEEKRSPVHFNWLVLRHVLGHSADTISTAYTDAKTKATKEAVQKGINEAAKLSGLTLEPLQTGPVDTLAKSEAVQDAARRLHLP